MQGKKAEPFVSGSENGNARLLAHRLFFLYVVDSVEKRVAGDLEANVRPAYDAFRRAENAPSVSGLSIGNLRAFARALPAAAALHNELTAWGKKYHLDRDDWILDSVLDHMRHAPVRLGTVGAVGYWEPAQQGPLPPVYRPNRELRAQYQARVRAYMKDVEAEYAGAGWTPAETLENVERDTTWLAQHQVKGMTYKAIAAAWPRGTHAVTTISGNIQKMAGMLKLTLRPAPGRS